MSTTRHVSFSLKFSLTGSKGLIIYRVKPKRESRDVLGLSGKGWGHPTEMTLHVSTLKRHVESPPYTDLLIDNDLSPVTKPFTT